MSLNNQYLIPSINKAYKLSQKSKLNNLSPNLRPLQSQTKKIQNNLFPKSNHSNFNIKVNKIRLKKENIIEGELNFDQSNNFALYNQKPKIPINKQKKRMPNKSPIPIKADYKSKDIFSFNKLFNSNHKYIHHEKNYNQNMINNYLFVNNNSNQFSKTFSSFYKKNNNRSHTPILRTANNKPFINLPNNNKINAKIKRQSKSPILGKSFNFKRNGKIGIALANIRDDKKLKFSNNVINRGLKGDIHKEYFLNNNINNINNINNNKNNLRINRKGVNVVNVNLRPISHNNNYFMNNNIKNKINVYDEEINMALLKLNNNNINNININKKENNNLTNDKIDSNKKITRPKSPKNNPNKNIVRNNLTKNHIIISDKEENKNIEIEKEKQNENNKIEIKQDESTQKKILRSHSQTPLDPLKQNDVQESFKNSQEEKSPEKPEKPTKTKITKKIRDIYEYSHVGFDGEQPKENNQDNYFIYKNFADHKDYIYLSVCDGHGIEGHFVSDFIKDALPYCMSENLKNTNILTEKELTHQIITETFIDVNNMLVSNENINSLFSGSTCVSVIYTPERLIVPNIGDSRAVLARYDKITKTYKAIDLSRDHKPTEKDESQRIYENDGRIQPFTEEGGEFVGPQRVWLKNEEVPGLAMTRSFGDRVAATVGVISEPEIKEFDFDENDKFMIIASDGIWEFISSQECVNIVKNFYEKNDLKGCADFLYEESSKRWLKEEEVIDDTTLILVFFD